MMVYFNSTLLPGDEIVLAATKLFQRLKSADLCINGEGGIDRSSLSGKTPVGVAALCRRPGVRGVARVRAGSGGAGGALLSGWAGHGRGGLETLVGVSGTVGGALRTNAGDRSGDVGQYVRAVQVLDRQGNVQTRERDELVFGDHASNLDDP